MVSIQTVFVFLPQEEGSPYERVKQILIVSTGGVVTIDFGLT